MHLKIFLLTAEGLTFVVMKLKLLSFFYFIFCFCTDAFSQVFDDSLANTLVKRHVALNISKMTMPGFRVQLFTGNQRTRANDIRSEFMLSKPMIATYLIYQQPNFKVRVGDFKTRLEAQKLLNEIQIQYPAAFIVKDEVKLPEIK